MYSNNKEIFPKFKRKKKQNKNYYTFDELINQPQLILQILESSLTNQKNFIIFIKNNFNGFPNAKSIKNITKIFNILPYLIKNLDLPFASLFLEENDLLQILIEIYATYNEFSGPISSIFENIYILFDAIEDHLFENPIEDWKDILFDLDIINENKIYLVNNDLTNLQTMFINLNNLYDNWIQYRNMGNNIEEENLGYFDECLKLYIEELQMLQNDDNISMASLEYFEEMIIKIENFRNEKFLNGKQYINNQISLEDQFNNININGNYEVPKINKNTNQIKKQNIKEILNNLHKIPLNKRTFFYKNEKISEDENLLIEYKDYYFPFGDKQIMELKRQICGFINSEGGRLYIGITDQKIIKGIVLNNSSLNSFQNLLFSCIDNFSPKISDRKITVYYIPIKNIESDQYIENLYVIKLIIYPGDPRILYSMSPKTFFSSIRLQGQCANLTAEEIHKNIIDRHKNKNIIIKNEKDFDDPPPEINKDKDNFYMDIEDEINQSEINQRESFYFANRKNRRRKRRRNKNKQGKIISVKIFNIDENILVKDLQMIFKDCGCFSFRFFQKRNGKSKGFGYIYFNDDNSANLFIQSYTNAMLGNKILKFKKAYFSKQ